jgi:hypothetical protein
MKKKSLASVMLCIGVLMAVGVEVSAHDEDGARSLAKHNTRNIDDIRMVLRSHTKMDCDYKKNITAVLCDIVAKQPSSGVSCSVIRSMLKGC